MHLPAVRPLCLGLSIALVGACSTPTDRREADDAIGESMTPTSPRSDGDADVDAVVVTGARVRADATAGAEREAGATGKARRQSKLQDTAQAQPRMAPAQELAAIHAEAPARILPMMIAAPPPPPAPSAMPVQGPDAHQDRENYTAIDDNPLRVVAEHPVSTFSIDVDTGSYANVRRMLVAGHLPPADAVRAEELINYFDHGYRPPASTEVPFSVTTEIAPSPWNAQRHLMLVGIKGYEVAPASIPASNLVFLVDTSGSMASPDKLPLLKESLALLVAQMRPQDRVAIVAYAGNAGLVLPSTPGSERGDILAALERLQSGGSTNGGAGIELAYEIAARNFVDGGVNRVLLATDGDFNVGTVDLEALKSMVETRRESGIALSTLGFGTGNYNDALAEQLADIGNGSHGYIDSIEEGHRLLVDELSSTLLTIAADVKIQVEFNPAVVAEYRLVGYENRTLAREDFANDRVDAGEIGAGHDVTALYEIALVGSGGERIEPLRYGGHTGSAAANTDELAHLRLRYKHPGERRSALIETPIRRTDIAAAPGERLRFVAAIAAFADALRGGESLAAGSDWTLEDVRQLASGALGHDPYGRRAELVGLIDRAASLRGPAVADIAR